MKYRVVIGGLNDAKTAHLIASRQHMGPGVTVKVEEEPAPYARNGLPPAPGMEELKQDHLEQLYRVAKDADLEVLDQLGVRAGLIWVCPVRPWNNPKGEPCGDCGMTESVARAEATRSRNPDGTLKTGWTDRPSIEYDERDPRRSRPRSLAARGAMGHHGSDDYEACVEPKHWEFVPQEVG